MSSPDLVAEVVSGPLPGRQAVADLTGGRNSRGGDSPAQDGRGRLLLPAQEDGSEDEYYSMVLAEPCGLDRSLLANGSWKFWRKIFLIQHNLYIMSSMCEEGHVYLKERERTAWEKTDPPDSVARVDR